jgi:hypothetical protein
MYQVAQPCGLECIPCWLYFHEWFQGGVTATFGDDLSECYTTAHANGSHPAYPESSTGTQINGKPSPEEFEHIIRSMAQVKKTKKRVVLSRTPDRCGEMCCFSSTVPLEQIRVKWLVQGHIDRFFTLSALVFEPATFQLLTQCCNAGHTLHDFVTNLPHFCHPRLIFTKGRKSYELGLGSVCRDSRSLSGSRMDCTVLQTPVGGPDHFQTFWFCIL